MSTDPFYKDHWKNIDDDRMATLLARQSDLFEWMDAHDGWAVDNRIDTVLTRLGFVDHHRLPACSC